MQNRCSPNWLAGSTTTTAGCRIRRAACDPGRIPKGARTHSPISPGFWGADHRSNEPSKDQQAPNHGENAQNAVHGTAGIYAISFAIANAAAAASPPTAAVCRALRKGLLPVKVPVTYPKISNASTVTTTNTTSAVPILRRTKYGANGTRPPTM